MAEQGARRPICRLLVLVLGETQTQLTLHSQALHYAYRSMLYPLMAPSVSPQHIFVTLSGMTFQLINGTLLGAWLAVYGPTTAAEWAARVPLPQFALGILIFYLGISANFYHDEHLREIRRAEARRQEKLLREDPNLEQKGIKKHYQIPTAGLFRYVLFAHYLVEWVEWFGFWMACGWSSLPAMMFFLNEVVSMTPRAVRGKWWYEEKFGKDKLQGRWAIFPGII